MKNPSFGGLAGEGRCVILCSDPGPWFQGPGQKRPLVVGAQNPHSWGPFPNTEDHPHGEISARCPNRCRRPGGNATELFPQARGMSRGGLCHRLRPAPEQAPGGRRAGRRGILGKPFDVFNSRKGFDFLRRQIDRFLRQTGATEASLVFEPTADFFRTLVNHHPAFRAYDDSLRPRGQPSMVACCAGSNKFRLMRRIGDKYPTSVGRHPLVARRLDLPYPPKRVRGEPGPDSLPLRQISVGPPLSPETSSGG